MTHVACESKLRSDVRSSIPQCPGNLVATGCALLYNARTAHAFSAGTKCQHCIRNYPSKQRGSALIWLDYVDDISLMIFLLFWKSFEIFIRSKATTKYSMLRVLLLTIYDFQQYQRCKRYFFTQEWVIYQYIAISKLC